MLHISLLIIGMILFIQLYEKILTGMDSVLVQHHAV